jgi:murein L,D-transpeptidase YcbB/YkuD
MVVTIAKTEQGTNVIDKIITHGSFDEVFEKFMTEFAEYDDRRSELYETLKNALNNPNLAAEYDTTLQGACKAEVPEESSEDRIQRTNRHLGRRKPDDDTLENF